MPGGPLFQALKKHGGRPSSTTGHLLLPSSSSLRGGRRSSGFLMSDHRRLTSSGGGVTAPLAVMVVSFVVLLLLTMTFMGHGKQQLSWRRHRGDSSITTAPLATSSDDLPPPQQQQQQQQQPASWPWPVWWFAPFWSGSGYGDEAASFVAALLGARALRPADLWLTHAGDAVSAAAVRGMDPGVRALLEGQEYARLARGGGGGLPEAELARPAIAVCHTFPDCWSRAVPGGGAQAASGGGGSGGDADQGGGDDELPMSAPGCPCPAVGAEGIAYRVGRSMFETAGLPKHLVAHANAMDELWVPTEFNRASFAAAGVAPGKLRVVPEGIDAAAWDPAAHAPLDPLRLPGAEQLTGGQPRRESSGSESGRSGSGSEGIGSERSGGGQSGGASKPFIFLSVFKLEARKGWDVLLDAYLSEFGADEAVELHLVARPYGAAARGRGGVAGAIGRWLEASRGANRTSPGLPRVFVHSRRVPGDVYPRLYAGADAVVLPTRGEGWGRCQMEAMAMARPLITTNWSGPTAYVNGEVGYPLRIDGLSPASEDMAKLDAPARNPWFEGERWARPSVSHLRELMRRVVARPEEAEAKGRAARERVQRDFSPAVIAAKVVAEVARIEAALAARSGPGAVARRLPRRPASAAADERLKWRHVPSGIAIPTKHGPHAPAPTTTAPDVRAGGGFTHAGGGGGGGALAFFDAVTTTLPEALALLEGEPSARAVRTYAAGDRGGLVGGSPYQHSLVVAEASRRQAEGGDDSVDVQQQQQQDEHEDDDDDADIVLNSR